MATTIDTRELARLYEEYKAERERIKQIQREELEDRIGKPREDFIDEINRVNSNGMTIPDIADALGIKNRSFLYRMAAHKPANHRLDVKVSEVVEDEENTDFFEWETRDCVLIHYGDRDSYYVNIIDNKVPLAWYAPDLSREELQFYREVWHGRP